MKKYRLFYLVLVLFFLFVLLGIASVHDYMDSNSNLKLKVANSSERIHIIGNQGWEDFKDAGNCTGSGTFSDPYIIKDLIIDGAGKGDCITIENSNAYFRVQNSTLLDSAQAGIGVSLINVSNAIIITNNITSCYYGIHITDCTNNTIYKNNITNLSIGIRIERGSYNNIKNNHLSVDSYAIITVTSIYNTIVENTINNQVLASSGIWIRWESHFNNVSSNNISFCENDAVKLVDSNNNSILDNYFIDAPNGVSMMSCYNNTILRNKMYNSGIYIDWRYQIQPMEEVTSHQIDTSNTVNDKPIYFYYNRLSLNSNNFSNAGQIILMNCNNSYFSDLNLTYTNYGIQLFYCHNNTISRINASRDSRMGIVLYESTNNRIHDNNASYNNFYGISLRHKNFNNSIINNTLTFNEDGLHLLDAYNNTITQNLISDNNFGVLLKDGSNDHNLIQNNFIKNNNIGLGIKNGAFNLVILNEFYENGQNAYDNRLNNNWDNGTIGNFWSDYNGKDIDDDGVGDSNYLVDTNTRDYYPIWWDPIVFTVNSPFPSFELGNLAPDFSISIEEGIVNLMWYTLDEGNLNTTFHTYKGLINQSLWQTIQNGLIPIKFFMNDSRGIESSREVIVYKNSSIYWNLLPYKIHINNNWTETESYYFWCSGSGTILDPYTIKDLTLDGYAIDSPILIENTNTFFLIKNCSAFNSGNSETDAGLELINVSNGKIINCTFSNNKNKGMLMENCSNNEISNNFLNNNNDDAIYLSFCFINKFNQNSIEYNTRQGFLIFNSNNNSLNGNYICNNYDDGIYIRYSEFNTISNNRINNNDMNGIIAFDCYNNSIFNNYFYDNYQDGLDFRWSMDNLIANNTLIQNNYGIWLEDSPNNTLIENKALENNFGIGICDSDYNAVVNNSMVDNGNYGIHIIRSTNNLVFKNNISESNICGIFIDIISASNLIFMNKLIENNVNAEDNGISNDWYNGTIGNYWSDYSGKDIDDNGIGDIIYNISGTAGVSDPFPIWWDAPVISIISPNSNELFGESAPNVSVSIVEGVVDTIWYLLDNGTIITGNFTYIIEQEVWEVMGSGTIVIKLFSNDSRGYIGYTEVIVRKDVAKPIIEILSPLNFEVFGKKAPAIIVNIVEFHLDSIWYALSNGTFTTENSTYFGYIDEGLWNLFGNGTLQIFFYANDSMGNIGLAQVTVYKDSIVPVVIINDPNNGDFFGTSPPEYDLAITEDDLDAVWYTMDDGVTNITVISYSGTLSETIWDTLPEGAVIIIFYANDVAGNIGEAQITIYKDSHIPVVNINDPESGFFISRTAPEYNIAITEDNLDTVWYTMDDGATNITIISYTGTLSEPIWDTLPEGAVVITFYANDTAGNVGVAKVTVYKDTIDPIVVINDPGGGDFISATAPKFNIAISEDSLDSVWYTLKGVSNNFTIISYTGTFSEIIWDALPEGPVVISFYANDTAGNNGLAQVTVYKDSIDPVVTINKPETGDEFTTGLPLYDIDVTEENIYSMWYTINQGQNITVITMLTGFLEEEIWNFVPYGPVEIIFYANDTAGNIGYDHIIIYKKTTSDNQPLIPGPHSTLILMVIFLSIVCISWRNKKKEAFYSP